MLFAIAYVVIGAIVGGYESQQPRADNAEFVAMFMAGVTWPIVLLVYLGQFIAREMHKVWQQ
jgi:hypothetical protein